MRRLQHLRREGAFTLGALLLILGGGTTLAAPGDASPGDPPTAETLPATVVTASRVEEDERTVPQTVTVATHDEVGLRQIEQPSDALADEPGIWIQQTGAGGGAPILRGLIGNKVLYLVDGIRINNGRLFGGPNAFLNQVDAESVDRIEALLGPGAVQYGSDAMGGVLNLRTRSYDRFPSRFEVGGRLSARFRTVDEGLLGHLEAHAAGERFNVLVGGTVSTLEDYRGGKGLGTIVNTSRRSRAWMAKANLKLAEDHILTAAYLENQRLDVGRHDQSRRNPSGTPRFFNPIETRRLTYLRDHIKTDISWIRAIEPYAYFQEAGTESDFTSESSTEIRADHRKNRQRMWGGGIQATTELPFDATLVYGVDVRYETFHDRAIRVTTPTSSPATTQVRAPRSPDGTYDAMAAYLMATWWPAEVWRLNAGFRVETAHLNASPSPLDVSPGFTQEELDLDERWTSFTYSFGTLVQLTDRLAFTASVASGFRAPTFSDTLSRGPFTFGVNGPSPDADPETSFSYELGPRWGGLGVRARLAWFQTFLQDQLTSRPTGGFVDLDGNGVDDPGEAEFSKRNAGSSRVYGIEASGEWLLPLEGMGPTLGKLQGLSVYGSISWAYGQDLGAKEPLRFVPPTHGLLGLRYRSAPAGEPGWELDTFLRMARFQGRVGSRDARDPARASDPSIRFPSSQNPPLRRDLSVPGFATWNARLRLSVTENATVYLAIDNILDKRYRVAFSRQDAPGFGVTLGAELHF